MASIWVEGVGRSLTSALDLLARVVRTCPEPLWDAGMWRVERPGPEHPFHNSEWVPITEARTRDALTERWVERRSTPWSVAWHALESLDYDINGEFSPWSPPPPFAGHPHWRDLANLPGAWSRTEILGYLEHCRGLVQELVGRTTDELAARPLPASHRYGGQPHAWILAGLSAHTSEHAAQIGQFVNGAGRAE